MYQIKNILLITVIICSTALSQEQNKTSSNSKPENNRKNRDKAVSLQLAWNGLVGGLGGMYTQYFNDHRSAVDGGIGISANGFKFGAGYRYLLKPHRKTSPFAGLGLNYTTGSLSDMDLDDGEEVNPDTIVIQTEPSAFLHFSLGLDYHSHFGIFFMPSIGYSYDLIPKNYTLVSGTENPKHVQILDIMLGSGIVVSFTCGYIF